MDSVAQWTQTQHFLLIEHHLLVLFQMYSKCIIGVIPNALLVLFQMHLLLESIKKTSVYNIISRKCYSMTTLMQNRKREKKELKVVNV